MAHVGECEARSCHLIPSHSPLEKEVWFILLQDESKTKQEETLKPKSQLDLRVQELLKLICDVQTMEEMMIEMKYDTKRAPLGKTRTLCSPSVSRLSEQSHR